MSRSEKLRGYIGDDTGSIGGIKGVRGVLTMTDIVMLEFCAPKKVPSLDTILRCKGACKQCFLDRVQVSGLWHILWGVSAPSETVLTWLPSLKVKVVYLGSETP